MPLNPNKSIDLARPNIVGPIAEGATLAASLAQNLAALCDVVEFRLDALGDCMDDALAALAGSEVPAIVTVRSPEEGGSGDLTVEMRASIYLSALAHASMLDIEIRSLPAMTRVVEAARQRGVPVLGSFHDFEKTPPAVRLREKIQTAASLGADAAKIAVFLDSEADLATLLSLLDAANAPPLPLPLPLSVMGMGALGAESRKRAALLGSFLNYGYLLEANAPGQISAAALKAFLADQATA